MKTNNKIEFIINMRMEMIFSELRKQESICLGPVTKTYNINAIDIYRVLINREYKKFNSIEPSDLEETIADEAGKLIRAYVEERYTEIIEGYKEIGKDIPTTVPYPDYEGVTLEELKKRSKNYQRTNSVMH